VTGTGERPRRQRGMRIAATVVLLLASASRAVAYSEEMFPRTLTATSPSGVYRATLVPGTVGAAQATLELRRRGRVVWRAGVLWGGRGEIAVADDGHVATIDDRPWPLGQHSVVIYDPAGALIVDDGLKDFVSPEELRRVRASVPDIEWRYEGDTPAALGAHLFITSRWGTTIVLSLKDGKVSRDSRRFGRLTDYLSGALASEEQTISVMRNRPTAGVPERDICTLSAAGCQCQRSTVLDEPRGPVTTRPLAPGQWKTLIAGAAVLVPLIETSWKWTTDPTKVQVELSIRRRNAGWDRYHVTLDPTAAQGDVARLVRALLDVTGL